LRNGGTSGQFADVAKRLEEASRADDKSTALLVLRAELEDMRGKDDPSHYDQSIALYRQALERDDKNIAALNNLGWLLALHANQAEEAVRLLDKAESLAGPVGELLDTRGVARLKAGQTDRAIKDLKDTVAEQSSATAWYHLAAAQHQAGNSAEAKKALAEARKLKLDSAKLHPLEKAECDQLLQELK
jgi:tetratricopeptide (TPR) repeat protein